MKKLLLLLICLLFIGKVKAQINFTSSLKNRNIYNTITNAQVCNPDSMYQYYYDTTAFHYVFDGKSNYSYVNNDLTTTLSQSWNGFSWDSYRGTCTYNSNHNAISGINEKWNGSAWVITSQSTVTYTYDVNNNITNKMQNGWTATYGWQPSYYNAYTYDANNNMLSDSSVSWQSNGSWSSSIQVIKTYNSNNKVTSETWNGTSTYGTYQTQIYTYTYDANNNMLERLLTKYTNPPGYERHLYTYDANNNQISDLDQNSTDNSNWINTSLYAFTYCSNNCLDSRLWYGWNGVNSTWYRLDSTTTFCNFAVGIQQHNTNNDINIYPNPTTGVFTIETQSKNAEIKISNLIGEEISAPSAFGISPTGEKISFDVSSLQNGVYFVSVKTNEGLCTKKIVVQH